LSLPLWATEAPMTPQRSTLLQARKVYSQCARLVESRAQATGVSQVLSDQIIGVGIATDWVRRAAEMEDIEYLGALLNESARRASFVELLRYGFSWFGLNAIFSRPALLHLIGNPANNSEYDAFLVLYNVRPVPNASVLEAQLHKLLSAQTSPRLPNVPSGTTVSTLHAIYAKYIPAGKVEGRAAKALRSAATSGNISALNLPTLIYGFRNWFVHGNALDGSFGTRPGFLDYVGILQQGLADVHLSTAIELQKRL